MFKIRRVPEPMSIQVPAGTKLAHSHLLYLYRARAQRLPRLLLAELTPGCLCDPVLAAGRAEAWEDPYPLALKDIPASFSEGSSLQKN